MTWAAQTRRVYYVELPLFGDWDDHLDIRAAEGGVQVVVPHIRSRLRRRRVAGPHGSAAGRTGRTRSAGRLHPVGLHPDGIARRRPAAPQPDGVRLHGRTRQFPPRAAGVAPPRAAALDPGRSGVHRRPPPVGSQAQAAPPRPPVSLQRGQGPLRPGPRRFARSRRSDLPAASPAGLLRRDRRALRHRADRRTRPPPSRVGPGAAGAGRQDRRQRTAARREHSLPGHEELRRAARTTWPTGTWP